MKEVNSLKPKDEETKNKVIKASVPQESVKKTIVRISTKVGEGKQDKTREEDKQDKPREENEVKNAKRGSKVYKNQCFLQV